MSHEHLATSGAIDLSRNVACLIACQEDEDGANSTGWAARPNTVCEPNCFNFSLGMVEGLAASRQDLELQH